MSSTAIVGILLVAFATSALVFAGIFLNNGSKKKPKPENQGDGIIETMNFSPFIQKAGGKFARDAAKTERLFDAAKNPWGMSVTTFQFIRFVGLLLFSILGLIALLGGIGNEISILLVGVGFICFFYPTHYYKSIAQEREMEWNKMYEYIWVVKNNISMYDPAKAFLEIRDYIASHSPQNKEIISGFNDFYQHWNEDEIDSYIKKYYGQPVPRELFQIIFNMHKTGEFPEMSLNSLRQFIINSQDLNVEKTLASVAGKATIFSLPFMMLSVMVALMVPLIYQLLSVGLF